MIGPIIGIRMHTAPSSMFMPHFWGLKKSVIDARYFTV
jgi:hypothetical protein